MGNYRAGVRLPEMGWMPDCRACAWHDGTLAVEWRREARKMIAFEHYRRMEQMSWLYATLAQLGVNDPSKEQDIVRETEANARSRTEAIRQSYEEGRIHHGPGYCQQIKVEPVLRPWWRHLRRGR